MFDSSTSRYRALHWSLLAFTALALIGIDTWTCGQDPTDKPPTRDEKTATQSGAANFSKHLILVIGAPGADQYGEQFEEWAKPWQQVAQQANARLIRIGPQLQQKKKAAKQSASSKAKDEPKTKSKAVGNQSTDREQLKSIIEHISDTKPVWIILIGHGTYDGRGTAKFNLKGPDVSAAELASWLKPKKNPLMIVNCASASAPFSNALSGQNRIVITSTKSGFQINFSRFGQYFSTALMDNAHDLDKDGRVSLLEAFLAASAKTQEYYRSDSRLATEHALIDDNGDGQGTPADWFTGIRVTKKAKPGTVPDGPRANQVFLTPSKSADALSAAATAQRDQLELEFEKIRSHKTNLTESDYYDQLEKVLIKIAKLYDSDSDKKSIDD